MQLVFEFAAVPADRQFSFDFESASVAALADAVGVGVSDALLDLIAAVESEEAAVASDPLFALLSA